MRRILDRMGAHDGHEQLKTSCPKPASDPSSAKATCLFSGTFQAHIHLLQAQKGDTPESDIWLIRHCSERFMVVNRLVDQLARSPQDGGNAAFHELCCAIDATSSLTEVSAVLGVPAPEAGDLWDAW